MTFTEASVSLTVMTNLEAALRAAGAWLRDVLKSTVYVATTERVDLVSAWDVVHRHFGDHDAPSTLLGVTVLGHPDQLVEVEVVACSQLTGPQGRRSPLAGMSARRGLSHHHRHHGGMGARWRTPPSAASCAPAAHPRPRRGG